MTASAVTSVFHTAQVQLYSFTAIWTVEITFNQIINVVAGKMNIVSTIVTLNLIFISVIVILIADFLC